MLPGASVEAASPVLIEKVRSVVTDATGRYRIVDLRPGTYTVTVTLTGFTTVKREGIELSGSFVATVDADLTVGALAETITVTGESPIVDVQSTRNQQILNRDVLAAIPSSRNINGIQAIIPGMGMAGDDGGITATMQGGASNIHGGRANDSRIYADGINMGWAGSGGGGGNMPQVAAAQEVVMTVSGGLAEAETGGVVFNAIPRDGSNSFSGQFNFSGSKGAMQGSNYTQALKDAGLRAPFELINVYDTSGMYGGRIVRDKLWFYTVFRQVGGERTVPGMFQNKNAGNPNSWTVDFDTIQAGLQQQPRAPGDDQADVAGDAAQQVQLPLVRAVQRRELRSGWRQPECRRRRRKRRAGCSTSRPVNPTRAGNRRFRAGCWPRPAGARIRPGTASRRATTAHPRDR